MRKPSPSGERSARGGTLPSESPMTLCPFCQRPLPPCWKVGDRRGEGEHVVTFLRASCSCVECRALRRLRPKKPGLLAVIKLLREALTKAKVPHRLGCGEDTMGKAGCDCGADKANAAIDAALDAAVGV